MKKNGILNSEISKTLSFMGHTDCIAIADCGLPIPEETTRIDLALSFGHPGFMEVLSVVAGEMQIEKIILAEEIKEKNPSCLEQIEALFAPLETGFMIEFVPHCMLKAMTKECRAVVRTGEVSPYANIILQSGCIF